MRDHRKLRAFQFADSLVMVIYEKTKNFPKEEMFGLTSQMRRAAVSVAANIVEGSSRESMKEYIHFLSIAHGSLRELGYYIELSMKLGYLGKSIATEMLKRHDEAAKTLGALIRSLRKRA